jgi:chromosome segregation ATPase
MNPLDAILVPPAMVKRAFDDLHDIARLARRYARVEDEIRARVEALEGDIGAMRAGIDKVQRELVGTRRAAEPLSAQMAGLNEQLAGTRTAVEPLAGKIGHMEQQLDDLAEEMAPIQHLEPIRRGIEPLERSMTSVRESVDELEPMVDNLDQRVRQIDPKLDDMQDSIEPLGDLAEKIPGNRKRRSA